MAYLGTKPANQIIDSTLIADGTVTTADIADNAITTAKIAAGTIVPADLSTGAPVWDSFGNVGIGTSSPAQKLDVSSTTGNVAISVRSTFSNASSSVYYGASRGWFVGADVGGGDGRFAWYDNTAGAERMRIDSSGRVTAPFQPAFCYWMNAESGTTKNPTTNNTVVIFDGNPGGGLTGYNRASNYNTSNGRFTAPVAGVYHFDLHAIALNSTNSSEFNYKININGITAGDFRATNYTVSSGHLSINLYLNVNDYVDVRKNDGTGIGIYPNGHYSWFSGYLIG